jgi:hypothetical protein
MSNRAIKRQVFKRIEANRQRAADVLNREELEAEAIKALKRADRDEDKAIVQKLRRDIEN